ncbi:hypothetical protein DFP72DRAFT_1068270 [Ephemerocybe angulata]|nr:hypothetical protein DFP72DRAFT_1068270 [Tulosesus angulatus]
MRVDEEGCALLFTLSKIVDLAIEHRLPTMLMVKELAAGGSSNNVPGVHRAFRARDTPAQGVPSERGHGDILGILQGLGAFRADFIAGRTVFGRCSTKSVLKNSSESESAST